MNNYLVLISAWSSRNHCQMCVGKPFFHGHDGGAISVCATKGRCPLDNRKCRFFIDINLTTVAGSSFRLATEDEIKACKALYE